MRKLLLTLAVLCGTVSAWAQVYQKVPHTKWTVTALNEAGQSGNEGGVAYLKDENSATFYHSNWSGGYSDGTTGKNKGQDGVQAFMVEMAEVVAFDRLTYTGRSDKGDNWATKVRVYIFDNLPSEWPKSGENYKALNTLTYAEKENLLKKESNTVLGTPAFDNNETGTWAEDRNVKTIEFATPQKGKYILFVADATTGTNGYFTCSDFHVWQKVNVVEDQPYFLKIKGLEGNYYLDTRVGQSSNYGNTICKTETPVATYFTLNNGYWHISSMDGNEGNFVKVANWDAVPGQKEASTWTLHEVETGVWSMAQSTYYGASDKLKHYLGANDGNIAGNTKVYTDKTISQAVRFELVTLSDEELAIEKARVLDIRKSWATDILNKNGVGYPVADSDARQALKDAIDADDATKESLETAIAAYLSKTNTVKYPEAGKAYRIVSGLAAFKSPKNVYSENGEMKWGQANESAMNQIWTVQNISKENSTITISNVADAMYPQKSGFTNAVRMRAAKNQGMLEFLGKAQFKLKMNNEQGIFATGNNEGAGTSGTIQNYNTEVDQAGSWYIEEVAVTKEILTAQINAVKTAYLGSVLIKQESIAGLQSAVDAAQQVCDAEGDYAQAFADLVNALNAATIEYIDLGYFYMKSKGAQKYAYNDNNSLKVTDSKNVKAIFKLAKANNGTFFVQNGNGYYAQNVNTSTLVQSNSAKVEYDVVKLASGHYALRPANSTTGKGYLHDANNGTGNIVGWSTDADNTQWVFEALSAEELAKLYSVTMAVNTNNVSLTFNGDYVNDYNEVKQDGGFYLLESKPTPESFTVNNASAVLTSQVQVYGNNILLVEGYSAANVYYLRCKKDNSYARYHSGSMLNGNNMLTYENNNLLWESLFLVEKGTGDYVDYYTIRPVSAPTLYVYNLKTANESSTVATKEKPAEGDLTANYYWKISSFGENPGNITPYGDGGDAYGWNKRGNSGGYNHIGYWKDNNDKNDNLWYVNTLESLLPALPEASTYNEDNSVLGYYEYENVMSYSVHSKVVSPQGFAVLKSVMTNGFNVVLPQVGNFYRFKHPSKDAYMLSDAHGDSKYLAMGAIGKGTNNITSVFYYGDGCNLLSYAIGRYLSNADGSDWKCLPVGTVGNKATFGKGSKVGTLGFYIGNNSSRSYYSARETYVDAGGTFGANAGYDWVVEKVTSLPVTITSARYATFFAPVAVEIPEDVEAYYADADEAIENAVSLTAIEEGVIPANTGVILKVKDEVKIEGEANTYNFNIVADVEAVEDNMLAGTVASAYVEDDAYVLSKQGEDVGMYKAKKNQVENTKWLNNGFKAYLPANVLPSASARFLIFDFGTETGIDQLEGENGNVKTEVYDLSGRRVQSAQKGIFIVNGKKVIR